MALANLWATLMVASKPSEKPFSKAILSLPYKPTMFKYMIWVFDSDFLFIFSLPSYYVVRLINEMLQINVSTMSWEYSLVVKHKGYMDIGSGAGVKHATPYFLPLHLLVVCTKKSKTLSQFTLHINCQWNFILITILKTLSQLMCSNIHVVDYNWNFEHEG